MSQALRRNNLKTSSFAAPAVFLCLALSSCTAKNVTLQGQEKLLRRGDYDVVLEARPVHVKPVDLETSVDAVEAGPGKIRLFDSVVLFQIDYILMGEFIRAETGGPSKAEQAREAIRQRDLWKLLTLDFQDPGEKIERRWIRIAVRDPKTSFGILSWENPEPVRFKLYLKRSAKKPGSFILTGVVKSGTAWIDE